MKNFKTELNNFKSKYGADHGFKRAMRRFRRRWFPTTSEKKARKNFTKDLLLAGRDINEYVKMLKRA